MNSRIPPRPISTPSPLAALSLEDGPFSERGLLERSCGSVMLRGSGGPTPPKTRNEGEIEKVKVYARIRPALRDDETPGALVWSEDGGQLTIFRPDAPVPQSDFTFDKVLGPAASQADVYTAAVSDVVADVLRGYNGTILAYGQTGAGKTHTLGNTAPDAIGMIPRAAAELFSAAARDTVNMYRITMSYIQIYMEMIQDLLNPTADNLPIREDSGGVFVAGACEVPVTSLEECLHYLELGEQNRVFAFTHLNAHSSRSHAVVMLTAVKSRKYLTDEERAQAESPDQDGVVTQKVTVGKLYMVDLAGSERLKKSKSVGLRATEARSINLSLTMLGMCISARAQDSPHVPFRDSKLTRLLQESLGGNAKTSLILCLSDVRQHADESLQSLQFGARAARVCNKPVVNERLQMRQLTAELLAALEEGNERTNGLEAALTQTKEERDALQAALARERARSAAIVDALRAESRSKDEQAAAKLAQQAELLSEHVQQLDHVQQQQGQLAREVAKLREEQRVREQAHQAEVAELQERLAAVQAAAAAERQALEAEARSQQERLAAAAQQQAAALSSQIAAERSAAREQAVSIHLALTRLQRALGELVAGPIVVEDGGAGALGAGSAGKRCSGGGRSSDSGGGGSGSVSSGPTLSRPAWMAAGLAAAAAAAVSRRGLSSGSGDGNGGGGSGGGSTAVQMIQAALGLTGAPSDGAADASTAAVTTSSSRGGEHDGVAAAGPTAAAIAALVGGGDAGLADGPRRLRASLSLGSTAPAVIASGGGSARDRAVTERSQGGLALAAALRSSQSASMPGALPAQQQHQHFQQHPHHRHHNYQHQQPQMAPTAAASVTANGGSGGGGRSAPGSQAPASSEIRDIDAALAAAQQDLLADLRVAAAAAASGSGARSVPASAVPPAWSSGVSRTHGLTWPLPSPAAAAAAVAASSARGAGGHLGQDTAGQPSPPRSGRNSASAGAAGNGGSGGYASEYAAAVANGTVSPGRQYRSYSQLHGASAAAAVLNGLPAKPPRANGTGTGSGAGASDSSCGGALRDEASGQSCASVSIPCPPNVTLGRGSSSAATPTASITTGGYSHGYPHPHYSQQDQGHPLSTPFMDERGRQAAAAASPSPTSRDTTAAAAVCGGGGGGLPIDLHTCSGILNLNPAFDTCDSEAFALKADRVLMQPPPSSSSSSSSSLSMAAAARERMPSEAAAVLAAATNMALLAAVPPAPLPPPPLPMFTGIQVQLDALLDVAAALRRVKTGLEARVVAQACELARRQEEQQHLEMQSRGDLQASRSALAAAELQLAASSQELNALRLVLADTVDELGRTRLQLDERSEQLDEQRRRLDDAAGLYDSALMRMGETRGRLDEALCELDARRGEVARLKGELEAAKADLASERAALAISAAASARSQAVTTQALAARHELQRQVRAANAIKRAFKAFKLAQLRDQVAAKQRELREAEAVRREREALQAARAGQALVQESVGVIQDAVGSILAAFVGRRHQLEAAKSLQNRMERIMSQGGASGAGSTGGYRASSGGGSKTYSASATYRMPPSGLVPASAAAAPTRATMTVSAGGARSVAAQQAAAAAAPTPARNRRQMSSPLSVMLSAVTLPQPQTPASTAASTGRPVGSVDNGVGVSGGGGGPTRGVFPPVLLQLQDDTMTTASSATPRETGGGSSSRGGSGARGSGGGGAVHGPAVSGLGGDSGEVRSGGSGGRGDGAASGGGSAGYGGASGGGNGRGNAVEARLVSGSSSSACGGRGGAAAGTAEGVEDDPGSPTACGPCSSSSSCSGVGAGRVRGAADLAPAAAEALKGVATAGFSASSPLGGSEVESPAAATEVTGTEHCAMVPLPPLPAAPVPIATTAAATAWGA